MTDHAEYDTTPTPDEELDLVGAAILQPELATSITLPASDFADPRLGAMWAAIGTIHAAGHAVDPLRIVDETKSHGTRITHAMVVDLVGRGMVVDADYYAERIRDAARRRRLRESLIQALQKVNQDIAVESIVSGITSGLEVASPLEREVEKTMTLTEFIGQDLPPEEWVIPGLLTKGDRLVLTGVEGGGKSQLMRQIGICAAGGRHPFTLDAMEPRRVLYIDCENPLSIMVKTMARIERPLRQQGVDFADRMWIKRFPQGIDLSTDTDRLMLHALCRMFRPDVLMLGPVYKLCQARGLKSDEDIARLVTMALDGLREEFGFALILEHHSPHGQNGIERGVRPIGSSLWLRWPEFGYGLRPSAKADPGVRLVDFIPWRGARDQRDWPRQLVQGSTLPWLEADPR